MGVQEVIREAVEQLNRSLRGRRAMKWMLDWMDDDGLGLDTANQDAVITLLQMAWGPMPGTTRDALREAVGRRENAESASGVKG